MDNHEPDQWVSRSPKLFSSGHSMRTVLQPLNGIAVQYRPVLYSNDDHDVDVQPVLWI